MADAAARGFATGTCRSSRRATPAPRPSRTTTWWSTPTSPEPGTCSDIPLMLA